MKKTYESPKIEVIEFATEDIMNASGGSGSSTGGVELPDDIWQ